MKTVFHKGYQGKVDFEDGTLVIRVLHIDDVLIAECDSASQVQTEFASLVDAYLEDCAELGREATKPFKGTFNVRVTPEVHKKAAIAAADDGLSLNAWVAEAMSEKLECQRLQDRVQAVFENKQQEIVAVQHLAQQLSMHVHRTSASSQTSISAIRLASQKQSPWLQAHN